MPDSAVLTFTDPDAYLLALRDVQAQGAITGRGKFRAVLTRVDFHGLSVHVGEEPLPRVASSALDPKLSGIVFATNPAHPLADNSALELRPSVMIYDSCG